ncbi:MAG: Cytochrome c-type biogenesis protein CcmE [Alphaproteobacteria bacterium MarineAlpha5_Bin9]|nr:MAG: Cytochrome c-type biogenesis protein CcmE [Alphaproteobacteria bacterium MarineAlpha5_Bin9]
MSIRFQRIFIIIVSIILISIAITLILYNSRNNIIFFYTPSELIDVDLNIGEKVRIGGIVKENSINKKKNIIKFIVTDNKNEINVNFEGILPDLFREKQGVVTEGKLINKFTIKADKVFAKHDENYIPKSIKKQLKNNDFWQKDY